MLAVSVGMVVVPLVYPFGIRIGSTRILGPTSTAIVFIIGGLVLLVITLSKVRLARALAANGGKIVVDADSVTLSLIHVSNGRCSLSHARFLPRRGSVAALRRGRVRRCLLYTSSDPFSFGFYSCGTFCQSFRRRLSRTEHRLSLIHIWFSSFPPFWLRSAPRRPWASTVRPRLR